MSMVHVAPEVHLVLDPMSSLLAAERDDVIQYSMDPIVERIDDLDKIADDLVNSLAPDRPLLSSFPGRENTSYSAGIYSNLFYGVIVGLVFSGILAIVIYMLSMSGGL
ncbi:tetrahydromethanopterin S-methyltransferase subunit B [Methanohalophilus portucalensis]|uniref:Tetrahydromethanopterin S-methyltransferase subunit B n=3 Tax=Methanohalophilus portucalensis TaxID=39664 RepID=A0A1X7NPM6_9EURY|nr:tetrahydromethanopterin S-methyltransferase subunit B [Methanohalophilus portucalensis]ATU07460.1 tetrahydromethanopterin S-methyltransferase subunit B [Methanohalophilus portucalensis]RNI10189.1 tetrahydromethanopterin S-methyltransferase subunit B [Methanohalophilus portucalensis FDF-1]SMH39088.1 tetrahydromethanopterin S-methyltransferase, subunit B [Methanohalophilus portucalensis FDF-1]